MSSPSSETVRVHVYVSGRVQGVGYRFSTYDQAHEFKLAGWVRNLPDGRVEAVFEGTADRIQQMMDWCHQGPSAAKVVEVTITHEPPAGLKHFEIRR